jgi:hypothetical protein
VPITEIRLRQTTNGDEKTLGERNHVSIKNMICHTDDGKNDLRNG